jgi:membrane associated rhomboid family serine protease
MFQSSKVIKTIFYANVILFIITLLTPTFAMIFQNQHGDIPMIFKYLAMWSFENDNFLPTQLLTYQFLHSGVLHILFNMLVLLSFGPSVENILGEKRMWTYYLLCGISGAVLHNVMITSGVPMVGASASVWGIMALFTLTYPNEKMYLFFIPVGIKGKYLIGVMFLYEVFSAFNVNDNISHFGHIGGALMGGLLYFYNKKK